MSDFYPVPDPVDTFDADEAARISILEGGNAVIAILRTWMTAYEKFWMTPRTHGNRALTRAQVQAKINAQPAIMADMLADSAAMRDLIQTRYPEKVGDNGELVPTRYMTAPYDMDGLNLTSDLKPAWEEQ